MGVILRGRGVLTISLSWGVIHTVFALRYARLYYNDPAGGIDFKTRDYEPNYRDFGYVAFTIGMTFQVSDTDIRSHKIRRTVQHALLVVPLRRGDPRHHRQRDREPAQLVTRSSVQCCRRGTRRRCRPDRVCCSLSSRDYAVVRRRRDLRGDGVDGLDRRRCRSRSCRSRGAGFPCNDAGAPRAMRRVIGSGDGGGRLRDPCDPRRSGARPRHRRGRAPDQPRHDVRAVRGRRVARLLLLPRRQSHATRVRGVRRVVGERARRARVRERHGCRRRRAPTARSRRERRRLVRRLRRDVPAALDRVRAQRE